MQDDKSNGIIVKHNESAAPGENDAPCNGGSQEKNHWGEFVGIPQRQQEQLEKKRNGGRRHPAQQGPEENWGQEENRQENRFESSTDPLVIQEEHIGHYKKRRASPREKTRTESEEKSDTEKRCSRKLDSVESEEKDPLEETKSLIESLREIQNFPYKREDIVVAVCDDIKKNESCHLACLPRNKKRRYTAFSCLVPLLGKYCFPKHIGKEMEEEKKILKRMDRIEGNLVRISHRIEKLAQRGGICKKHSPRSLRVNRPDNSEKSLQVNMSDRETIQTPLISVQEHATSDEVGTSDVSSAGENSGSEPHYKEAKVMKDCAEKLCSLESKFMDTFRKCGFDEKKTATEDKDMDLKLSDTSDDCCSIARISENFAKKLCGIEKSFMTSWSSEETDISSESDETSDQYDEKGRTVIKKEYSGDSLISTGKGEPDQQQTACKDDKVECKKVPYSDDYEPYVIKKPDGIPRSVQKRLALSSTTDQDKKI